MSDQQPSREELAEEVRQLRQRVAQLEQADPGRRAAEKVLREIAQGVSSATGQAFFQCLVKNLAETLDADFVSAGSLVGEKGDAVRTVAIYSLGELVDNITYDLANTPCEHVVTRKLCCHPQGVQELFPQDRWLAEMQVESYVGTPLFDSADRAIGLMAVMDRKAIDRPETVQATLCIFAARAAAELERQRVEEALRESEERLRRFFEAAFEGLAIHDRGLILDANQKLADLFGYEQSELLGMHALDMTAPAWRSVVRRNILTGREEPYEAVVLRKDGSAFPCELCGKPIPYHGQLRRVTAVRDITARKQAEEKLQQYAQQLQALSRRLLEVQESERRRLARELHDEIGQVLTGLKLLLEGSCRHGGEEVRPYLDQARELVTDLMGRVRDLSQHLRPTMLDDLGLMPTLVWLIERYTTQTEIEVRLERSGLERRMPPEIETAVYRIVQEALTNVARHAAVREVTVRLRGQADVLTVQVEDQGVGFDPTVPAAGQSSGLSGMRERVALLGGQMSLESRPGAGTRLTAVLPIQEETMNDE